MLSSLVTPTKYFKTDDEYVVSKINKQAYHPYYGVYTEFQKPYSAWNQDPYNPARESNDYKDSMVGMRNANYNYRFPAFTPQESYLALFSDVSVQFMSKMITGYLKGVHPENKNIIVPNATILSVCDSVYNNDKSDTGTMQQMVIQMIVNKIREEFDQVETNNKLDNWVINYDGTYGIKQFNNIKLNDKGMNWNTNFQWRY